jgi:hypothetical protein
MIFHYDNYNGSNDCDCNCNYCNCDDDYYLQAATITDEDIDAIIQKGVQSTEELNAKMKDFTDNAMRFTMDGGIAYEYKDGEEEDTDNVDYKSLAGSLVPSLVSQPRSDQDYPLSRVHQ